MSFSTIMEREMNKKELIIKWEQRLESINQTMKEYKQNENGNEETFNEIVEQKWIVEDIIKDLKELNGANNE